MEQQAGSAIADVRRMTSVPADAAPASRAHVRHVLSGVVIALIARATILAWKAPIRAPGATETPRFLGALLSPANVGVAALLATVFGWVSIACHESGHAIAMRRVGVQPQWIRIGAGPRLCTITVAGIPVSWHLIPATGVTVGDMRLLTVGQVRGVFAAGPRSHLGWAALGGAVALIAPLPLAATAVAVCALELTMYASNHDESPPTAGSSGGDGWQIKRLSTLPDQQPISPWRHAWQLHQAGNSQPVLGILAAAHSRTTDPAKREELVKMQVHLLAAGGQPAHATQRIATVLAQLAADAPSRPVWEFTYADRLLMHQVAAPGDWPAETDSWVAAAVDRVFLHVEAPAPVDLAGQAHTRAMLALVRGDAKAAVSLCAAAAPAAAADAYSRHVVAATMAIALARTGDAAHARAWAADVPLEAELRPRLDRELAASTPARVSISTAGLSGSAR